MTVANTIEGVIRPTDAQQITATPPRGWTNYQAGADVTREYVSGVDRIFISKYIESLPKYVDDITRDFGYDLYERMLLDPKVQGNMRYIKGSILGDGWTITPAVEDEKHPLFKRAKDISDFCQRCVDSLSMTSRPFDLLLYEMLDGLALGHKTAEQVHDIGQEGPDQGKIVLRDVKTKPRGTYAFVVDAWRNTIGMLGLIPGHGTPIMAGNIMTDPRLLPNFMPRTKFVVFTHDQHDSDPRGRPLTRACYFPWWAKQQLAGEWLKFLAQYADPSLWGTTAEGAQPEIQKDVNGNPTGQVINTPEEAMVATMKKLRGGGVAAFPFGAGVNAVPVGGEGGKAFYDAFQWCDAQITFAMLSSILQTTEAQFGTRAQAETHADTAASPFRVIKLMLNATVRHDIFRVLVAYNYGDWAARHLVPKFELNSVGRKDWVNFASAAVALVQSGFLDDSQKRWLCRQCGIPEPAPAPRPELVQPKPQPAAPPNTLAAAQQQQEQVAGQEAANPDGMAMVAVQASPSPQARPAGAAAVAPQAAFSVAGLPQGTGRITPDMLQTASVALAA